MFLVVGLLGHAAHLWYTHARRRQRPAMGARGHAPPLGAAPLLQIVLAQALAFMGDAGGVGSAAGWGPCSCLSATSGAPC